MIEIIPPTTDGLMIVGTLQMTVGIRLIIVGTPQTTVGILPTTVVPGMIAIHTPVPGTKKKIIGVAVI